jgi:Mn2+/Fe2+ NRAMP family transporter
MTFDTTVAVVGALLVTVAFLILGVELLQPTGLLPEDEDMAAVLGNLLSGVWGRVGFWMMITGVFIGFFDTLLSDQDGFGRLFANGARLLSRRLRAQRRWGDAERLRRIFVIGWVTVVPLAIFFFQRDPVGLLMVSGGIEAAHIPVVTGLILYLNVRRLPAPLRPSPFALTLTAIAGVFFAAFAVFFLAQSLG